MKKKTKVIKDYDEYETTDFINKAKTLSFKEIGLKIPNIPYQAMIKLFLADSLKRFRKKAN